MVQEAFLQRGNFRGILVVRAFNLGQKQTDFWVFQSILVPATQGNIVRLSQKKTKQTKQK